MWPGTIPAQGEAPLMGEGHGTQFNGISQKKRTLRLR